MISPKTLDEILPFLLSGFDKSIEDAVYSVKTMPDPTEVIDTLKRRYKRASERELSTYNEMLILEKIVVALTAKKDINDKKVDGLIKECRTRIVELIKQPE